MTRPRAGVSKRSCVGLLLTLGFAAPMLLAQQRPAPPSEVSTSPPPARVSRDDVNPGGMQGCPTLPRFENQNIGSLLEYLARRGIRHRKSEIASVEPAGVILGEPTTAFTDGRCYVSVDVSDGSLVLVPNLLDGARPEAAERRLAAKDLRMRLVRTPSNKPVNTVIAQNPLPEREVKRGSVVEVSIAVPDLIDLPDVIGMPFDRAEVVLFGFVVRPSRVASARPEGEVIGQLPSGPTRLPRLTEVQLEISDGSLVVVPPVEEQPADEARAAIEGVGLVIRETAREDPSAPTTVVSQDPAAGETVVRGTTVQIIVSSGLEVPKVVGEQLDAARSLLGRFEVQETFVQDVAARGVIVMQRPEPGTRVAGGSQVELDVSDGSLVVVPPIEGEMIGDAREALESRGLVMEGTEQEDPSAPNTVISQDPGEGETVARGSVVRTVVSTGIEVPRVVGEQLDASRSLLASFEVQEIYVNHIAQSGEIVLQRPEPGTRVAAGSRVEVDVSEGSLVVVPPIEGEQIGEARESLESRQLVIDATEEQDPSAPGTVVSQDPSGGESVARGATVRLVVSTGIEVPDVVGLSLDEARDQLSRFRLVPTTVSGFGPAEKVVKQSPPAGERHAAGTEVLVDVSDGSEGAPPNGGGGVPGWAWLLGGLAAVGAGATLLGRARPHAPGPPLTYGARLESSPDGVRISVSDLEGPSMRIAARFEIGVSKIRFDGDSS